MSSIVATIQYVIDLFLHLDVHLTAIIGQFGIWTYALLFFVIFMETGFVVTPFLPGDSLLFAAGALAALGGNVLHVGVLFVVLAFAAVLGDTANYWIGHAIGPRVFKDNVRFLKREYLDRTHAFYEKHGGKTIFLARFVPIIRTFAPFVAGVGEMTYAHFIGYNVAGGIVWTALFTFTGYFFGNIPFIKHNFSLVIIAIILISLLPAVIEYLRGRRQPPATPSVERAKSERTESETAE
jgi:membrane-associated protein